MKIAEDAALFRGVCGLSCENGRLMPLRFTPAQHEALRALDNDFERLSRCSAGVSLAFETDAEEIAFSLRAEVLYTASGELDILENGVLTESLPLPPSGCDPVIRYRKKAVGRVRMEIFLPANAQFLLWDFSLGNWSPALPPDGPLLLFYGDSLTQCAYIPQPSLSFAALVCRGLNGSMVNRGIGSLFYDASILDENDPLRPQTVFCQYGINDIVVHENGRPVVHGGNAVFCREDELSPLFEKADAFFSRLCRIHSSARLCVLTPFQHTREPELASLLSAYRRGLTETARKHGALVLCGSDLVPNRSEYFVADGVHLNTAGNRAAADSILAALTSDT